jgi:hypothetical protein
VCKTSIFSACGAIPLTVHLLPCHQYYEYGDRNEDLVHHSNVPFFTISKGLSLLFGGGARGGVLRRIYLPSTRVNSGKKVGRCCYGSTPRGTQRPGRGLEIVSGVGLLLLGKHGHVHGDAPRPCLGPLGILDLVQDGVPIPTVELIEELASVAGGEGGDQQIRLCGNGVSFRRSVLLCDDSVEGPVRAIYPLARSKRCKWELLRKPCTFSATHRR